MNLFGRESSRAEDRFEAWLKQKHQDRVLSGQTDLAGPCPDEAFLRGLAVSYTHLTLPTTPYV